MTKPHWQTQHEWWIEDMEFEIIQSWAFKLLLRQHPDDEMTHNLKSLIKLCENNLKQLVQQYKKIYGTRPNIRKMRAEIEKED